MQEIEVVEAPVETLDLVDLVPELRTRYLETFLPYMDPKDYNALLDRLLTKIRLSTKSELPEINVNNAIAALKFIGLKFVIGVDITQTEEHLVTAPFPVDIEVIGSRGRGDVAYKSVNPSNQLFRAMYIKVEYPHGSNNIKEFDLSQMSEAQALAIWSWSVGKINELIISSVETWVTYANKPESRQEQLVSDTEYLRLASELEEITGRSFIVPYNIFYYALSMVGYARFVDSLLLGQDNTRLLSELRYEISAKETLQRLKTKIEEDRYNKGTFLYYAKERLPADRHKKFVASTTPDMTFDEIQQLLSSSDLKLVLDAISDEKKKVDALTNNNCPHKKLVATLSSEVVSDEKADTLKALTEYLPADHSDQELIPCNKCKFPLMCPHDLIMQRGLADRKNTKEIKDAIKGYIYPDSIQGNYVCRICGQVILSISSFDLVVDQYSFSRTDDDPEVSAIWTEVSYMTRYITFKNLVNKNSFVSAIVSLIWPLIESKVAQIMTSRGSSAEELNAKKRINNAIYIFAAFINLSVTSASTTTTSTKDTVGVSLAYPAETQGKDAMAKMFNFAASTIWSTMTTHIRRVPGMSIKMIAQDLVAAYRSIAEKKKGPIVQMYDESGNTDTWLNSSWFEYICAHTLDVFTEKNINALLDKIAPFKEIAQDTPKKKKQEDASSPPAKMSKKTIKARQVNYDALKLGTFKLPMPFMTPEDVRKKYLPVHSKPVPYSQVIEGDPMLKAVDEWYKKYFDQSFILMIKYFSEIYPKIGYNSDQPTQELAALTRDPDMKTLKRYEQLVTRLIRYVAMKNFHPMPDKNSYATEVEVPLAYIYKADGTKRSWSEYGPWKRPEGKKGPWVRDEKSTYKYVWPADKINSWKDSAGYTYASKGDDASSDADIIVALRARERIENMIAFYEFICPKGDLHEFGNTKKCTKCEYIQGKKSPDDEHKYYDKFLAEYQRDQKIITPDTKPMDLVAPKPPQKKPVEVKPLDFNLVIEAAKFCGLQPNMIASIGAYEKVKMKDIQDNKFTAPVTTSKAMSRPDKIRSCCISMIIAYGSFVNIAKNYSPPADLLKLLEDVRVPKDIMSLDTFADSFTEKYDTVFNNNSSKDLIDFALGSFVAMILRLRDVLHGHKELRPIVDWVLEKTFGPENLSTKAEITNWSSILKKEREISDMNTEEIIGPAEDEDEDAAGGEAFGNDIDNEDIYDDGDDVGNQIKVRGNSLD